MKSGRLAIPFRPEPFVYRIEFNSETVALWTKTALEELLFLSTIVQLEAFEGLRDGLLEFMQHLDRHPQNFKLRLILPSTENDFIRFIKPLSKLKKSLTLFFIVNLSNKDLSENKKENLHKILIAFSSAGLKTGLMLELGFHPDLRITDLENLIITVRHAGALEIALRPSLLTSILPPAENSPGAGADFIDFMARLSAQGIPLALEECFPSISRGLVGFSLNCRQAYGSCFIDRNGLVKPCRLSSIVIGDLKERQPKDIFSEYKFSDRQYCFLASAQLQESELNSTPYPDLASAPIKNQLLVSTSKSGQAGASTSDPTATPISTPTPIPTATPTSTPTASASSDSASLSPPVILDSSLRPLPLFRFFEKPWGATIVHGYDSLILTTKGARIASSVDGRKNLRWFKKKFGEKALSFVYGLFLKGYVRFEK